MPSGVTLITADAKYKQAPKYTIGSRTSPGGRQGTPGPGSYNNDKGSRGKSWGFGRSSRGLQRCASAPGPGDYKDQDAHRTKAPGYGFGSEARGKSTGKLFTPGPGQYAPNWTATRREPPKFSAPPRRDGAGWESAPEGGSKPSRPGSAQQSRPSTPGPGHYNARKGEVDKGHVPAARFGTSQRITLDRPRTPGPGAYRNSEAFGQDGAPSFTMGRRSDQADGAPTPGPGGYIGTHTQFA